MSKNNIYNYNFFTKRLDWGNKLKKKKNNQIKTLISVNRVLMRNTNLQMPDIYFDQIIFNNSISYFIQFKVDSKINIIIILFACTLSQELRKKRLIIWKFFTFVQINYRYFTFDESNHFDIKNRKWYFQIIRLSLAEATHWI